jgi:hypothetical protein
VPFGVDAERFELGEVWDIADAKGQTLYFG